jgi:ferredoxin
VQGRRCSTCRCRIVEGEVDMGRQLRAGGLRGRARLHPRMPELSLTER